MICSKCGSTLPNKAKFCPECGKIVVIAPKCINGHRMQPGQKFCCECGAPLAKRGEGKVSLPNGNVESDKAESIKPSLPPKQNKGIKLIVKIVATLIIMVIIASVVSKIGSVPSYIAGGICIVIIPNVWKFIDDF